MRLSANLGFLFRDLALPDAIAAARHHGFDAVEMHWPYETDPKAIAAMLAQTGLPLLGVNTERGDVAAGDFGLSALPGREAEARAAIDQSVAWSIAAGCRNIHVMAGKTNDPRAFDTFADNLRYAIRQASPHGIGILIEPINPWDVPGYYLADLPAALKLVDATDGQVRIMFDCYHMQLVHGNLSRTVQDHLGAIGHIQFAAVPDRGEPDHGEVDYPWLLQSFSRSGYQGFYGAEYKPLTGSFAWMEAYR